jgi:PiT family inorganic phosphate transporter
MEFIWIIIIIALIFDFINGFHDAANSIATVISTKVLTPVQAVLWAAMFNFIAYFIFKDHNVANTVAKTVHEDSITLPVVFSGLIAAIAWNLITWWYGIPSSSSHTLIGGFAGAAIANAGFSAVNSEPVIKTISFIVLAPLCGMLVAFIISIWFLNAFRKGMTPKIIALFVIAGVSFLLSQMLEFNPEKLKTHYDSYYLKIILDTKNFKWVLMGTILIVMAVFTLFLNMLSPAKVSIWFKRMQLVSSAAFGIGHGGNDAQKVMGIITAALIANSTIHKFEEMPDWVPLACYTAMGLGTLAGGSRIIKTMGQRITKVTPFEGVAAETSGAITLFLSESLKIPVSTTHTITGSIMGVGATKRLSAVKWGVTRNIIVAWLLTIPVTGILASGIYFLVDVFI